MSRVSQEPRDPSPPYLSPCKMQPISPTLPWPCALPLLTLTSPPFHCALCNRVSPPAALCEPLRSAQGTAGPGPPSGRCAVSPRDRAESRGQCPAGPLMATLSPGTRPSSSEWTVLLRHYHALLLGKLNCCQVFKK